MALSVSAYEKEAAKMLKLYEQAEQDLLHKVSSAASRDAVDPRWLERKKAEIKEVNKELKKSVSALSKDRSALTERVVNNAYKDGVDAFKTEAQRFNEVLGIAHISPNAQKAFRILSELNESLDAADRKILRQSKDAYADVVGNVSARVAAGTITVREAVQEEVNRLADKGIKSFVDKAGRSWEMSSYAEMATLTAIEKATLEGYCDTMQSYGFDLAVISNHVGACPLCEAWQGVIISVSGQSSEYPSLSDAESAGVFHPRCLHFISTYYEGISKGTRSQPREVKQEDRAYSVRQLQRGYEAKIRRWERRAAVAQSPEDEVKAYQHIQDYKDKIEGLIESYNGSTEEDKDYIYRKEWREGKGIKLSAAARKLLQGTTRLPSWRKTNVQSR